MQRAHDVIIIGAGPIGIETAVVLKRAGLTPLIIEARQVGATMSWWPRQTSFFSTTERLAIAGIPIQNNHQQRITGEEYLAYLRAVVEQYDLAVNAYEPVSRLQREADGFSIATQPLGGPRSYRARFVVLATGDMDFPLRLNIPGEDLPHVTHYFRDPHDYFRRRLLVVGGRNSAVEAALRSWRCGAQVTLSHRRAAFDAGRVKHWLLPDIAAQFNAGTMRYLPLTQPVAIEPTGVQLMRLDATGTPTGEQWLEPCDHVLLATGFRGDQTLLSAAGVLLDGDNRIPRHNPATMETNVPGLYLAGTVAAGIQQRYTHFIETCHVHAGLIARALSGQWPTQLGDIPLRSYDLPPEAVAQN
jgi:thioredoxin reductase (NADPH)